MILLHCWTDYLKLLRCSAFRPSWQTSWTVYITMFLSANLLDSTFIIKHVFGINFYVIPYKTNASRNWKHNTFTNRSVIAATKKKLPVSTNARLGWQRYGCTYKQNTKMALRSPLYRIVQSFAGRTTDQTRRAGFAARIDKVFLLCIPGR